MRIGEVTTNMKFFMMNIDSPYNAILGRNWLGEIKVVYSPFHQKLKFPSSKGVVVVWGKQNPPNFDQVIAIVDKQVTVKSVTEKGESSSVKGKEK